MTAKEISFGHIGYISVSKSTIKRRLHQGKYRWFTTRCKPLVSHKNRKTRLEFAKKTSERETKINL